MAKVLTNAAAAATVFAALMAAEMGAPAGQNMGAERGRTVTQQSQVQRDNAPQSQSASASTLANMQPADDPKRRRHYQRRNPFRQVRRRMERQGWKLTGRQWRNL